MSGPLIGSFHIYKSKEDIDRENEGAKLTPTLSQALGLLTFHCWMLVNGNATQLHLEVRSGSLKFGTVLTSPDSP